MISARSSSPGNEPRSSASDSSLVHSASVPVPNTNASATPNSSATAPALSADVLSLRITVASTSASTFASSCDVKNGFTGTTCARVAITAINATSISMEFGIITIARLPGPRPSEASSRARPATARPNSA